MHEGQHEVSLATVRALVADQFPEWRDLAVGRVRSSGTVNAVFRLGEELAVRLPLRGDDADATRRALEAEAEAGRLLLGRTRFRTPEPVAIGEPGHGYPLPWSVQTWLGGYVAGPDSVADSLTFAHDLAGFVREVRAIDTGGRTFAGLGRRGRGGELAAHDDWMSLCLERSEGLVDVAPLRRRWAAFRELPRGDSPDVMTHGDLMPANLLVEVPSGRRIRSRPDTEEDRLLEWTSPSSGPAGYRGWRERSTLAGVLDCGGVGPADPALDLIGAWHLFEDDARHSFRFELGCDDLEWERGKAWAFEQSMGALWYYAESNPTMAAMARRTLARLTAAL